MKKSLLFIYLTFGSFAFSFAQEKLEAEEGAITGAAINDTIPGFSGAGYVVFEETGEVAVTVTMDTAGQYVLVLGYRSVFGEKTQDLHINGAFVESIVFPQSDTFTTLEAGQISLNAGSNTISIVKNWGYMDLDYFLVQTEDIPDTLPIAEAGAEQVKMDVDGDGMEAFTLDASGSTDPDDSIVSYTWYTDSATAIGSGVQIPFEASIGSDTITLEVTDAAGNKDRDQVMVFVGDPSNNNRNRIAIRDGRQNIFASGINLAWDDFARDIVALDTAYFAAVLDSIAAAGANAMRWWLHTNGSSSPQFDSLGNVSGIAPQSIANMRTVLDMAYERGIMISMCLWSFDMLQPQGQDQAMMKQLVENKAKTQTYIENALIPMLEEIGSHPAVMTWEIFNEAEGMTEEFGWTPVKTQMKFVQQFVNLTAGAVHRTAPEALVSTGVWSFRALTNKEGNTNYYHDDSLVAAGGDPDGTLDFYQVHYYPEHFGNEFSPFHRPADWWGLDKPILIGEFPTKAIDGRADPQYTTTEAYQLAIAYGYAGAMAWDYRGFDGGSFETAREGIGLLAENYADDILIEEAPELFNHPPATVRIIPDANIILGTLSTIENYASLDTLFTDEEDGTNLSYSIVENTNPNLVVPEITEAGTINMTLSADATGSADISIRARDTDGASAWASFSVNVREQNGNLALFAPATASSVENPELTPHPESHVNDGDKETRWSSAYKDNQWIYVDLDAVQRINQIKLFWEAAFGKTYEIQVSDDAENWTTVYTENNGDGELDDIMIDAVETRYVKMNGLTRGTEFGFSLLELEVYGQPVTGIEEVSDAFSVYPNPAGEILWIKSAHRYHPYTVEIYNLTGQRVAVSEASPERFAIPLGHLEPGIYVLKINTGVEIFTERIYKK